MKLFKYRAPNVEVKSGGGGSDDKFLKWNFNLNLLKQVSKELKTILNEFKNYEADFKYLPIQVGFCRLLPKSDRITQLFKCDNKKPVQIGSNYVFKNDEIQNKINITYQCSKSDLELTSKIVDDLISAWPTELINLIKYCQSQISKNKKLNGSPDKESQKSLKDKFAKKVQNYIKENNLQNFKKYFNDVHEISFVKIVKQEAFSEGQIVSFFALDDFSTIINKLRANGVDILDETIALNKFINLDRISLNQIVKLYPFLISKAARDIEINVSNDSKKDSEPLLIANNLPTNGTVGVIDTYASFKNGWENYVDYVEEPLPKIDGVSFTKDYSHGTAVSSLIIGNDIINDKFQDDFGNF